MVGITASGVGSGLDIESIVTAIMKAERLPIDKLTAKKTELQAQFTSYGKLSTALDSLRTASRQLSDPTAFRAFTTSSSNESVVTATASTSASAGTFDVEVEQLAIADKRSSAEKLNTDVIGTAGDNMTIQIGTSSFTVDIGGKTLEQIRSAINSTSSNVGVTARTITGTGNLQKLILGSNQTGTANAMTVSFKNSGGVSIADPLSLSSLATAQDSKLKVDGYEVTRSSNTVTDAITGVTLNLKAQSTVGQASQITVAGDQSAVTKNVQSFVDAYNKIVDTASTMKYKEGLFGDPVVRQVEDKLRSELNAPVTGLPFTYLAQVGVSWESKDVEVADGVMASQDYLKLDTTKLSAALSSNFNGVRSLFAEGVTGAAHKQSSVQKLGDAAQKQSSVQKLNTDLIGAVGDKMTISNGGTSFTVDIGGKKLSEIQDAINGASGNTIVAALVSDGASNMQTLALTSNKVGTANAFTVAFKDSSDVAIADPLGLTTTIAAQDADLIGAAGDNMTISSAGTSFTVDIGGKTLSSIRDAINSSSSNTTVTAQIVNGTSNQQQLVLTSNKTGTANSFTVAFKDSSNVAIADPLGLTTTTAAQDEKLIGVAKRMTSALQSMLKTDGHVTGRRSNLTKESKRIDARTAALEKRMTTIEARLRKQFATLDALVASFKSTGDSINAYFSNNNSK